MAAHEHPQFSYQDSQLVSDLVRLSKKSPKLVKSSSYAAPSAPNILLHSWKMTESRYYDIPSPFPTYARGLFSVEIPRGAEEAADSQPRYRIVIRGYDKFFNIAEVPWTEWPFLESHTRPPYILSLKSNGCIVFIAALTPSKLVVSSKHSLGPVEGHAKSHAQVGETWLKRYIDGKGRTEADLAKQLWDNNWTAIAELCDDSFEEHILSYPPDKTGLYLHGINTSTREFYTLSPETVDAFAEEWGFIKTQHLTLDTITQVREFTDEIRKTGTWNGEPIEGFVVRTHVTGPPTQTLEQGVSPYKPGSTFFFKIKFDEPYLLYRDWREVTKALLSMQAKYGHMSPKNLPKSRMRRQETKVYVEWAIKEIKHNPHAFDQYQNNKGIIRTREMFLEWLASDEGKKVDRDVKEGRGPPENEGKPEFTRTVIVPVAVPGSGKTSVSIALAHIFGFGHTQSDDVRVGKKPGTVFVRNVMNLLQNHSVVIADKNNHLRQHRTALREESTRFFKKPQSKKQKKKPSGNGAESESEGSVSPRVRLLGLCWDVSSRPTSNVFRICAERVHARGENHQTLRIDPSLPPDQRHDSDSRAYEGVIWKFIHEYEELSPTEVDAIVEMEIDETLEESVKRAVDGVVRELGLPIPDEGKVREGINRVNEYKVAEERKKEVEKLGAKEKKSRYYGFLPDLVLEEILDPIFVSSAAIDGTLFWSDLKSGRLLTSRPHVTIVHKNELPSAQDLWTKCADLIESIEGSDVFFQLHLNHVIWNGNVMALTVDDISVGGQNDKAHNLAAQFLSGLTDCERRRLHVTVGMKDSTVLPIEAKVLVEGWRNDESNERQVLSLGEHSVMVKARICGLNA